MRGTLFMILLGLSMTLPQTQVMAQETETLMKPNRHLPVRITGGTGFLFMNFTCLNRWFSTYNYPLIPSGSGLGHVGILWSLFPKWQAGIQLHQSVSGVQNQSGIRVHHRSGALDLYGTCQLISQPKFRTGVLGGLMFQRMEVMIEKQLPAQGSGLQDFLTGGGSFSSRNAGGTLHHSGRNVWGGIFAEYGSVHQATYGIQVSGSSGSTNRWQMNGQIMPDSPRMPLSGIRFQVYVGLKLA